MIRQKETVKKITTTRTFGKSWFCAGMDSDIGGTDHDMCLSREKLSVLMIKGPFKARGNGTHRWRIQTWSGDAASTEPTTDWKSWCTKRKDTVAETGVRTGDSASRATERLAEQHPPHWSSTQSDLEVPLLSGEILKTRQYEGKLYTVIKAGFGNKWNKLVSAKFWVSLAWAVWSNAGMVLKQ